MTRRYRSIPDRDDERGWDYYDDIDRGDKPPTYCVACGHQTDGSKALCADCATLEQATYTPLREAMRRTYEEEANP